MRLFFAAAICLGLSLPVFAQQPATQPRTATPAPPTDSRVAAFNKSLNQLRQLFKQRKFKEAVAPGQELVEQARALYGERHVRYSGSLYNLGLIYNATKQYEDAARLFKQAFIAQHPLRSPADKSYKQVLSSLAKINKQLGRARETGSYYLSALKKLQQTGQIRSAAAVYYYSEAGRLLRYLADFEDAEKMLRRALDLSQEISKLEDIALVQPLNNLAGLLRARGKYAEAAPLYETAIRLQIKAKGEWNGNTGILLDNLAVMYLNMGAPHKAEPYQKRALAIIEKTLGREHLSAGIALSNLAELQRKFGRYQESEQLFQRALTILEKRLPPNSSYLGSTYDNFAGLYRQQHKYSKAYENYSKALKILEAAHGEDHPEVAIALNNIGLALGVRRNYKEAESYFLRSLAITRKAHGNDYVGMATGLGNLADVRIPLGKLAEAEIDAKRAIELLTETLGPKHSRLIFPLTTLASIEKQRGNMETAFTYYKKASGLYAIARQRSRAAGGDIGDSGAINGLIAAAFTIGKGNGSNPNDPSQQAAFRFSQFKTLSSAGDALNKLGARLGASDPTLRKLARERQDTSSAWTKAEKKLLGSVSADPKQRNATEEAGLRAQILIYQKRMQALDNQLSKAYPQFTELSQPRPVTIASIQKHLAHDEVLLQYIVTVDHTFAWAISKNTTRFIRINLKRRDLRNHVQALRCGLDQAEWIGEKKPLRCLKLINRVAEGPELPFATKNAYILYQKLFEPFEAAIAGRKLLITGSDALARLPMHVLLTEPVENDSIETLRNAPWLVRRHAITVLPSASSFVILRRERANANLNQTTDPASRRSYLAIANPLLHGADGNNRSAYAITGCSNIAPTPGAQHIASLVGTPNSYFRGGQADVARLRTLEPLPETTTEVCAVARDLGAPLEHVLLGNRATETMIRKMNATDNGLERYRILHFATHGLVSGELRGVAEPALVLSPPKTATPNDDGLLTASEVAELKLNAEWVILSACNTAAGSGYGSDALSGLARSFFYAGARSLLVSHWPVRSDAAVALTTRAIRTLKLNPSAGRSVAIQQAMLSVIADNDIDGAAHPQVWAPFVVVGEGAASKAQ